MVKKKRSGRCLYKQMPPLFLFYSLGWNVQSTFFLGIIGYSGGIFLDRMIKYTMNRDNNLRQRCIECSVSDDSGYSDE